MAKFNAILKSFLYVLYSWILAGPDLAVPKKEKLWVIASQSGLIGNARFFAEYVLENRTDIQVVFYSFYAGGAQAATENYFAHKYSGRFKLVQRKSPAALLTALRAGCIFISHDLIRDVGFPLPHRGGRRKVINLWHGIAMKKHWLLKDYGLRTSHRAKAQQFNKVIASSHADALAKAASFQKTLDDIWITGYPRSDILMGKELPGDLAEQEESLKKELQGRRLVLYAPTWRSYARSFQPFGAGNLEQLAAMLGEYNCVLGLRLHEKDEAGFGSIYESGSCLNLGSARYAETQVLLKNTAVLVSDYSSIWLEFLLTERPVVAYWYDWDDYCAQRGFLWDLESLFPGSTARTYPELEEALRRLLGPGASPDPGPRYRFVKEMFHRYTDGKCTERVVNSTVFQD